MCKLLLTNVHILADARQPRTDVFDEGGQVVHRVDNLSDGEVIEYLLAALDDFSHLNNNLLGVLLNEYSPRSHRSREATERCLEECLARHR